MLSSFIRKTTNIVKKDFRPFPASSYSTSKTHFEGANVEGGIAREEMSFLHFRVHNNNVSVSQSSPPRVKFNSPRKKANKMYSLIQQEAMDKAKGKRPNVHNINFRVGDAIEMTMIAQGGVDSTQTEKIRGVVLGMDKRGLGTGIYLRDVVFGEPIDRKIPLYSPLLKEIKLLEENFVFKKKRKVKRAKLYYLRDRGAQGTFHLKDMYFNLFSQIYS